MIDQLGSWALDRYLPLLSPEGALRTGIAQGRFFPNSVYPYAATFTAQGHATIATGTPPDVHGVVANDVWDATRQKGISVVDDGVSRVLGSAQAFASPNLLRTST
ncbi:MAG TPA: alkaline phosphatase family protein, partial [Polyangiaceae bacterium]